MPRAAGQAPSCYEILGPFGAGATGEAHRARDARLEREAVSLIRALLARGLADEGERCDDPTVAPVHRVGTRMQHFQAKLVAGKKPPYRSWTFLVLPAGLAREWKASRFEVRGMIEGKPFRGTVSKGEGVHRMPLKKELLAELGVERGAVVDVAMELDPEPRPIEVPKELRAVLRSDPALARHFEALPPSLRRAWSSYVGDAKRQETRDRRARLAPERMRLREFPGA